MKQVGLVWLVEFEVGGLLKALEVSDPVFPIWVEEVMH